MKMIVEEDVNVLIIWTAGQWLRKWTFAKECEHSSGSQLREIHLSGSICITAIHPGRLYRSKGVLAASGRTPPAGDTVEAELGAELGADREAHS